MDSRPKEETKKVLRFSESCIREKKVKNLESVKNLGNFGTLQGNLKGESYCSELALLICGSYYSHVAAVVDKWQLLIKGNTH